MGKTLEILLDILLFDIFLAYLLSFYIHLYRFEDIKGQQRRSSLILLITTTYTLGLVAF